MKDSEATLVGRYDPALFCNACLAVWQAHDQAERAAHAQMVRDFEAWRADARRALKEGDAPRFIPADTTVVHARDLAPGEVIPVDDPAKVVVMRRTLARLPDED